MRRRSPIIVGLLGRLAVATSICLLYLYIVLTPCAAPIRPATGQAARVLDYPVGLVKNVLPFSWRPSASISGGDSSYCFGDSRAIVHYLLVGIPTYVALLYLLSSSLRWIRRGPMEAARGA